MAATQQLPYAGFVSRLIAFTIDLIIINVISIIIVASTGLIANFFGLGNTTGPIKTVLDFTISTLENGTLLITLSFTSMFGAAYLLFFWVLVGVTPGKALLGLRIVRTDGRPLNIGRALLRLIGYWLSALLLFLGFVLVIIDNRRQGLHDKLAGTVVIYNWQSQDIE